MTWPFSAALVSDAEMALAKGGLTIGERYAELVEDETLRCAIANYRRMIDVYANAAGRWRPPPLFQRVGSGIAVVKPPGRSRPMRRRRAQLRSPMAWERAR